MYTAARAGLTLAVNGLWLGLPAFSGVTTITAAAFCAPRETHSKQRGRSLTSYSLMNGSKPNPALLHANPNLDSALALYLLTRFVETHLQSLMPNLHLLTTLLKRQQRTHNQ